MSNFSSSFRLQTATGYIPLNSRPPGPQTNEDRMTGPNHDGVQPNTQDVRFMGVPSEYHNEESFNPDLDQAFEGTPWPPNANVITCEPREKESEESVRNPTVAVMTRAMRSNQPAELESSVHDECSSEELPHLSDLDEVVKATGMVTNEAKRQVELNLREKEEFEPSESEGSVMGEWEGPGIPLEKFGPELMEKEENGKSYALWSELNALKANITFGQLLEISPMARKTLKDGMPVARRKMKVKARIAAKAHGQGGPRDVVPVEIEATVVDKVVPRVLVDGGSALNILPSQTMEKLGLSLTGPSPHIIRMANQSSSVSLGQIKDCRINTGEEEYIVIFHVIRMHSTKDAFPMLLGRPWLRMANVVVEWGDPQPSITYGPKENRARVPIESASSLRAGFEQYEDGDTKEEEGEDAKWRLVGHAQFGKKSTPLTELELHDLGPNLYHWSDNGEYGRWLKEHPDSSSDVMTISCVDKDEWD